MKKRIKILALSVALTAVQAVSALEFSNTVFFGDSLTDSGAYLNNPDTVGDAKFTTSPASVWSEILADFFHSQALANNPNNPDTDPNGTNYAQGGAQVTLPIGIGQTPSPQSAMPIRDQVGTYLDAAGQADRNALYAIWGGANDVFFNMGLGGAGIPPNVLTGNVMNSATDLVAEVERLADAGARYILVPNLPDIGQTPAMLLQAVLTAGQGNPNLNDALIAAVTVLAMGGGDVATVQANALAAAEAALGYPAGSLTPVFEQLSGLATGLSQAFNQSLLAAANGSGANIIPLDIYSMIGEVLADPGSFGLLNVTGTACTTSSALACDQNTLVDPRAPGAFLFADGVHPTAAGQQLIADYALSVVMAPALIANLAEAPLTGVRNHQQMLEQQMRAGFGHGWSLFASGGMGSQDYATGQAWDADSADGHLMLGGAWRLNSAWVLGAAIDRGWTDVDFSRDRGSFEVNALTLSAFADYQADTLFANAIATVNLSTDLDAVERVVKMGAGVRLEQGDSSADLYAIKGSIGARLLKGEHWTLGPFASLNYQSVTVDAYRERGERATSMNFGSQDRDSLLLEGGVFADYSLQKAVFHGGLSYQSELKDDKRSISAGLNTLEDSRFSLYDIQPSSYFWKLDLGVSARMAKDVALNLGYALREGEGSNRNQYINASISVDF